MWSSIRFIETYIHNFVLIYTILIHIIQFIYSIKKFIHLSVIYLTKQAVFFDLTSKVFCEGDEPFKQCVDFAWIKQEYLKPYYVHTMCWSFIVPFFATLLSYSLVLCEINSMQVRDIRKFCFSIVFEIETF